MSCCAKLTFHHLFTAFSLTQCLHTYLFCISAFDVSVVLCLLLPGALLCSVLFLSGLLSTGVWGGGEGPWGLGGLLLVLPPLCCNEGQASLLAVFGRVWNIHTVYIHDHYLQFWSSLVLMTFLKLSCLNFKWFSFLLYLLQVVFIYYTYSSLHDLLLFMQWQKSL